MAGKLRPLAAGIKIAFAIGGGAKAAPKPAETFVPVVPPAPVVPPEAEAQQQAEMQRQAEAAQKEAEAQQQAAVQAEAAEVQRQYNADIQQLSGKPAAEYARNSTNFTDSMKAEIDAKAEILRRHPDLHVLIEGHACDLGSAAVNMQIGQRRADAAKAYLVEKGIATHRITTVSKGETEPIAPNDSEENRRKNRRIEIKIMN